VVGGGRRCEMRLPSRWSSTRLPVGPALGGGNAGEVHRLDEPRWSPVVVVPAAMLVAKFD